MSTRTRQLTPSTCSIPTPSVRSGRDGCSTRWFVYGRVFVFQALSRIYRSRLPHLPLKRSTSTRVPWQTSAAPTPQSIGSHWPNSASQFAVTALPPHGTYPRHANVLDTKTQFNTDPSALSTFPVLPHCSRYRVELSRWPTLTVVP